MQNPKPDPRTRIKVGKNRYFGENAFIDGYAKVLGWQAQSVYHALCRHEKNGTCFPSIKHLAVELGIGKTSVKRGLDKLKEFNLITWERRKTSAGGWGSNYYFLLDKQHWKPVSGWSNQGIKEGYIPLRP